MDFFEKVKQAPADPILGLILSFKADPRKTKINLGAGIYKTADLKSFILQSVKEAEKRLLATEESKDYLPIDGMNDYVKETQKLVFGEVSDRIYGAQTVGGTAALRVGGAFLRLYGHGVIYISDPTWANHHRVFQHAGLEVRTYPYFEPKKREFDFEGFYQALDQMSPGSIVLVQACCHNPTGIDPSLEQWKLLCERMQKRQLFAFIDFAYQGFGNDCERDAAMIRLFFEAGVQCAVAVSHSKNFGLYAERTGALYFVCSSAEQAKAVGSHLKIIIRGIYSNPPCHGARIVSLILQDSELKKQWLSELTSMRDRISEMRKALVAHLEEKSNVFAFLAHQTGMFSYTGLSHEVVDRLIADYGIYLPSDGRINVAGLNQENVSYVAEALHASLSV